ncbi:sialate O-acetylesterase [Mucilaginibacter sp.]|uniref:sialate O-acetylesterase n=1 Tax=Mucilaginibacter sp. TaxID=1882438 RepID=UPI00284084D6|nr:sialate O-acetylesterase [Mucilaginibacter sp.]MDR3491221.1 sialate O-acetylesterase [Gammaproteobacteria bacterium]MDR3697178.1 sialate O-acetylesterase [Mucilaginibacter sp.]
MIAKSIYIKIISRGLLPGLFLFIFKASAAQIVLPACFTDNMVLQQQTKVNLWGIETPGKNLTIVTSWNNKTYKVAGDANGDWKIKVRTPVYGGPYTITFNDGSITTLKNILIGEVWVCSGQSNMEMPLTGFYGDVLNLNNELTDAANYPEIRMLKIDNKTSFTPLSNVQTKGGWTICNPQTIRNFSAVAYFFAKNLFADKHIPIGIINSTWGGTVAEAWTSGSALKTMPAFAPFVNAIENGLTQQKIDAQYQMNVRGWMDSINAKDPGFQQSKPLWAETGLDDSSWQKMMLPSYWEQSGVPDYDGTMWFRKKVAIPAAWAGKDLKLNMGGIDDYDVSYFNGVEIGHTESFFYTRSYNIPGSGVKAGENTIAVRVFDNGGLGGINKGPLQLSLATDITGQIDLAGEWVYHKANVLTQLPQPPVQSNSPNRPTLIYNAMINPILPYTIKGVIWYQGESNADRATQYRRLFPLLINDWRQKWGEGNFPFYYVQIANYAATDQPPAADWPALRDAQLCALSLPNTGMAVTIDIGDAYRIHPQNKQEASRRLALIARAKTYGENISCSGPIYKSQVIKDNKIELEFINTNDGLLAKGDTLKGFIIAGADKKFYPARAIISGNKVIVNSGNVPNPIAVRYAWANNPVCNLYNGANLPASPFRTDDWYDIR